MRHRGGWIDTEPSRNALLFFFSSRRRHTRCSRDWSSDVCSSDLVDALGRPFVERSSSLILNCHGCRYQSKHYVLKNMWVKLEIPHPETGQPPRSVRGRVAWIQRPRTVRQLFQVAVELEVSGNLWGIAFPPEDWFAFPEGVHAPPVVDGAPVPPALPPPTAVLEPEAPASLGEAEFPRADASDNVRVFPSPASATDASLQLARQVARLVADARQQIQAAAQEAASHAVSAERRLSLEQWEQRFAAGRVELANETTRALERLKEESDKQSREAGAAAAEALRAELPRWLAPQLEQLTRDLTERLSREPLAQRGENTEKLETATDSLQASCRQAEETAARLQARAEQAEAQMARAESITRSLKQQEETAKAQREGLEAQAAEVQQQVTSALSRAQSSWREQLSKEVETAQAQASERLGRLNFLGKLFSPGRLSSTEGRSHLLLNFGGLGFEALALRFSGFFLLLKRASDGFCSGHLRFGLLCASLQARGRFLRLPAAGLERVRGGFEFLCVFAALCQGFPREPLRKIAGQLLELRGQPARQFGSQRLRCRGTCLARLLIALLLEPFQRPRSFIRDFHAPCGKLLLPLFQRETAFGGDRVRSGLLGSGLNLLSRVGDQSSYLSRQLERRIGGTGRRRKDPHIVARIGPWELGFAERSWRLGFQNSCGRQQGWWQDRKSVV